MRFNGQALIAAIPRYRLNRWEWVVVVQRNDREKYVVGIVYDLACDYFDGGTYGIYGHDDPSPVEAKGRALQHAYRSAGLRSMTTKEALRT